MKELYRRGREIAAHSITHNEEEYWQNGTKQTWADEMGGMRDMLLRWTNIPPPEIYDRDRRKQTNVCLNGSRIPV